MMIHLGIIGLGTIFEKQKEALAKMSDKYCLEAVCDYDRCKQELWEEGTFYSDAEELVKDKRVQAVLISTPPKSHYELAMKCFQNGKDVILEKPATISLEQLISLYEASKRNGCTLYISFHAAFAKDLLWFLENKEYLQEKYSLGCIKKIHCRFFDPYMHDDILLKQAVSLCGSYFDSAVNALSVCDRIVNLEEYQRLRHEEKRLVKEDFCTTVSSYTVYDNSGKGIIIETGFDRGVNHKETEVHFENGLSLMLNHSRQSVCLGSGKGEAVLVKDLSSQERLTVQYEGMFDDVFAMWEQNVSNEKQAIRIHQLLFLAGYEMN